MRYIGIDPSTKTGIVILDEKGNVLVEKEITSKVASDPQRFIDLSGQVCYQIQETCFDDDIKIAIEGFSFGSKGAGVSVQYGIGWAVRSELCSSSIPYIEIPPTTLKKFATGKGNASKDAIILPIYKKWGYEHSSDNVRDAYILARIAMALDNKLDLTTYQKEALKKVK